MALVEVKVPDIGDFKEVAVIELLVKPGDTVKAEQSLVTVESDKASMEIPSSAAGVVKELKVKLGDKVKRRLGAAGARGARALPRRRQRLRPHRAPCTGCRATGPRAAPRPRSGAGEPDRSKSAFPTSATSRMSPSSSCWSSPAIRSRSSSR